MTQSQQSQGQQDSGIDAGDLLNAGMAFMNAKNQGQDNLQAGLSALMAADRSGRALTASNRVRWLGTRSCRRSLRWARSKL
ncbi:MAG: hypothetical protein U0X93_09840 [Anaerolineales bacterium]